MYKQLVHHFYLQTRLYFQKNKTAKLITVGMFFIVFAFIALGTFFFFLEGFEFIKSSNDPYFDNVIPLYIYEIFFLVISLLIMLSGLITGVFSLFRTSKNDWIMASPRFRIVPSIVVIKMAVASIWPVLLVAGPALGAVGVSFKLAVMDFIAMIIALFLLVFFLVFWDIAVIMLAALLVKRTHNFYSRIKLSLKNLFLSTGVVAFILIISVWWKLRTMDLVVLLQAGSFGQSTADPSQLIEQFRWFPTHTIAYGLYLFQRGQSGEAFAWVLQLSIYTVVSAIIAFVLLRYFLVVWQSLREGQSVGAAGLAPSVRSHRSHMKFFVGPMSAIFSKELLTMARDFKNISWLLFSVALWTIYTALSASINFYRQRYDFRYEDLPYLVPSLQVLVTVYFVSALVLRFVLPSFSTERRTSWILASAPINYHKLFLAKGIFFSILFAVLGLVLGSLGMNVINFPIWQQGLAFITFTIAIKFVTIFGLALGAIYPNFETDDAQIISTSLPGLGFIFGSLIYGILGTLVFFLFLKGMASFLILFYVCSVILGVLLYIRAVGALHKIEFVKQQ